MIFEEKFLLTISEVFVKNFNVSSTLIFLLFFFDLIILLTIAKLAPLEKASFTNLLPSLFFPLIAKNTSFFLISFELIEPFLIFAFK